MKYLAEATTGYLQMCIAENETYEQIYRPAPEEYWKMYNEFVRKKPIINPKKIPKKQYMTRTKNYDYSLLAIA